MPTSITIKLCFRIYPRDGPGKLEMIVSEWNTSSPGLCWRC